ncbi:FAD-dependent oxidoreductase [Pontibaca methylaminivorans]|uniref:FAD-dependent oxidoreductase n=1 Tax=Pontibaca methylaminivorans TaxID=515897 RepID=UPI002FD94F28
MITEAEILIVGAGPSGLALAAALRQRGIESVIAVDQLPAGANTSRAAVIHARTLEVLEPLGVTSTLTEQGIRIPTFRVRDRDRVLVTVDLSGISSAYRFALMLPQDRTEQILLNRLETLGGAVTRPCELVSFTETRDGIEATLLDNGTARTVRAGWIVGCDGMHSRVRDQAGIEFSGAEYQQSFVLADVRMDWPLGREEVSLFFSPAGLVVVAPLPGKRFRIVATIDDAPELPSKPFMQELVDTRGPSARPGHIHDVIWSSRFRIHHRVAQTPRSGRVLLCGDAAHVHSPAGGQGMNTGIQDAVSLAEVLAQGAESAALDMWAAERHRVANDIVAFTDRMTRLATMKSSGGQAIRNAAISIAGHMPFLRSEFARRIAELNID